jgi:two-component system nitrogen regulation sensor histidine kinase NtrY
MNEMRKPIGRGRFRTRLLLILLAFAVVPTILVTGVWVGAANRALSMVAARSAWEQVAASGQAALGRARAAAGRPLPPDAEQAVRRHEDDLRRAVELARRADFLAARSIRLVLVGAVLLGALVALLALRVAGHLSRQLSRPLDELVGWTACIRDGRPLPPDARPGGGPPEFALLRQRMRDLADGLDAARRQALQAERAEAFRESARRFAHELKNPLTPIRFAVARLRAEAPPPLHETIDVLTEESARLDAMARSFAQFGRLPDAPPTEVDLVELVTRVARATVPATMTLAVEAPTPVPLVRGDHEALVRAVTNVLLNAGEACGGQGTITVRVAPAPPSAPGVTAPGVTAPGVTAPGVTVAIHDSGPGIPAAVTARLFDPYVTTKPGGTGLGLAIARQTVEAHGGTIAAASAPDAGTTITIRLPVAPQEEPSHAAAH